MPPLDVLRAMNEEDQLVAVAVGEALEQVSRVVERAIATISAGGRLVYVGAGTGGRIAYGDAIECPPTFGIAPDRVLAILAGGREALAVDREGVEDDVEAARRDIFGIEPTREDLVVGVSASGRTPYTLAALREARDRGAGTAAVVNARGTALGRLVDHPIEVVTGPEVLGGSTRLKAGTAQKMVLNMISTATMAGLGYVYDDLMVGVVPHNAKLLARAARAVQEITGCTHETATGALVRADYAVPVAVLLLDGVPSPEEARRMLEQANGSLRRARDNVSDTSSRDPGP
jgi:N-acetylmuramic acid 6-phosphate etherase